MDQLVSIEAALALHQQGQLDQAEAIYRQILQTQPQHFDALQLLATVALQRNDSVAAVDLFDQAIRINPNHEMAHSGRGNALSNLERYEEALDCYDLALKINPDFAEALNNRGNSLFNLERYEEALDSYDRALKIRPDYVDALKNRGNVLRSLNRQEEAQASDDRALEMEANPLVSVVVGSFNQEKYIRECVESVLAQTYPHLEIIFADDCSTDRTAEIIESCLASYKGSHSVTFLKRPHNLGNVGYENFMDAYHRTSGEFIVQFCGDDVMLPMMVEKMAEVWATKNLSMVTVNAEYVDPDSRLMGKQYRDPYKTLEFSLEAIACNGVNDAIFGAGMGFTRELFEYFEFVTGTSPYHHLGAGDIIFTFMSCLLNGCEMISAPQMKYRIHSEQASFDIRSSQDLPANDLRRLVIEEKMWCGHLAHAFYMREALDLCVEKNSARFAPIKERIDVLLLGQVIRMAGFLSSVRKKLYYDHGIKQILPQGSMA